jgi:hypothetical protein
MAMIIRMLVTVLEKQGGARQLQRMPHNSRPRERRQYTKVSFTRGLLTVVQGPKISSSASSMSFFFEATNCPRLLVHCDLDCDEYEE